MKLRVLSVGKVKQQFVLEGEAEYLKRLKPWVKLEVCEVEPKKEDDSAAVFSKLKPGEFFVALDERGKRLNSKQFADFLAQEMSGGRSAITFAIGGASGWSEQVRGKAGLVLSLSDLTFPYQLTRLILVEQIYRAFTIIKGQPYHK